MNNETNYDFLSYSPTTDNSTNDDTYVSYDTSFGDPSYLDRFLKESKGGADVVNERKKSSLILDILTALCVISIFAIPAIFPNPDKLTIILPVLITVLVFLAIIRVFTTGNRLHNPEGIANMSYITAFFSNNYAIKDFTQFGEPFCINDGTTKTQNSSATKISAVAFLLLSLICAAILFYIYNTNAEVFAQENLDLEEYLIISVFVLAFVGAIAFGVIRTILLSKVCIQDVDAVCVELEPEIHRSFKGRRTKVYRPIYYFNYNHKGYIVFNNSWSSSRNCLPGEYISNVKINPDNPFEYLIGGGIETILCSLLSGAIFLLPFIMALLSVFSYI